jgi:hypothetical protein
MDVVVDLENAQISNALYKLLERDSKKRGLRTIYTYTWAPHNVNGEIAHCFALRSPSCLTRPLRAHALVPAVGLS